MGTVSRMDFLSQVKSEGKGAQLVLRRYLLYLNDPAAFAKRYRLARPALRRELVRMHSDMEREVIRARSEIRRRARALLKSPGSLVELVQEHIEEKLGHWNPAEEARVLRAAVERLAAMEPQLRVMARRLGHLPGAKRRTIRQTIQVDQQLLARITKLLPDQLTHVLQQQIILCAICGRAFFHHSTTMGRPPRFCLECRKRWSKQQLWYRAKRARLRKGD